MANIVILGGGESGVGAALLAQQKGHQVWVSDRGHIQEQYQQELTKHGIAYEHGQHTESRILAADEVIKSPGIPDQVPLVQQLVSKGIPVISEIEFAGRYVSGKVMGITGSNGKTTTTKLAGHLLQEAGYDVAVVGNVGVSFARSIANGHHEYYVLELSSFQLDGVFDFRPDIALLLNITPDHLDRYDYVMQNYIRSKLRITRSQQASDYFLYHATDPNILAGLEAQEVKAQAVPINGAAIQDETISVQGTTYSLAGTALIGQHNAMNALFAVQAVDFLGLRGGTVQRALRTFQPVEHRMERVAEHRGVTYINDSKATNVDAAYYALDAMRKPIIWVAGGQDKGNDYAPLIPLVRAKARAMICLGADNKKLIATFGPLVEQVREAKSAEEAVAQAAALAQPGEVVLLSPACASFDLFDNYEQRGRLFKKAVHNMK